ASPSPLKSPVPDTETPTLSSLVGPFSRKPFTPSRSPRSTIGGELDAAPKTTYVSPALSRPPGLAFSAPMIRSEIPSPLTSPYDTEQPLASSLFPSRRNPSFPSSCERSMIVCVMATLRPALQTGYKHDFGVLHDCGLAFGAAIWGEWSKASGAP